LEQKKIAHKIVTVAVCLVMLAGAFSAGRISTDWGKEDTKQTVKSNNKTAAAAEPEKMVYTEAVAVVNLDEGIVQNEQRVYYSLGLIELPSDNFAYVGLEEARTGLESNTYAAYIIIPASFSEDVQSLNTVMEKSQITYETNSSLEEDTRVKTLKSLNTFVQSMSDNVSYLYVSGILEEFHEAQDNAGQVIDNDQKDKDAILAIQPYDLQSYVQYPELKQADMNRAVLDIQNYITKNGELLAQIQSQYDTGASKSEEDKSALIDSGSSVGNSLKTSNTQLQNLDVTKNGNGDAVYDSNLTNVYSVVSDYNAKVAAHNKTYNDTLEERRKNIQEDVDEAESKIVSIEQYWNGTIYGIDTYNAELSSVTSALASVIGEGSSTVEYSDISATKDSAAGTVRLDGGTPYYLLKSITDDQGNTTVELDTEQLQALLDDYKAKLISGSNVNYEYKNAEGNSCNINDLGVLQNTIEHYIPNCDPMYFVQNEDGTYTQDVNGTSNKDSMTTLFTESKALLSFDTAAEGDYKIEQTNLTGTTEEIKTADVLTAVTADVVTPLVDRTAEVKEAFNMQYTGTSDQLTAYQNSLSAYNSGSYIDQTSVQQSYTGMQENGSNMQTKIQERDTSQSETMSKTYETYSNNQTTLLEHIENAKKASDEAVTSGLSQAQQVKEESSSSNQTLMKAFTAKLPYTRLGSAENTMANQFIVNPLLVSEQVSAGNTGSEELPVKKSSMGITGGNDTETSQTGYQKVLQAAAVVILLIVAALIIVIQVIRQKRKDKYHL